MSRIIGKSHLKMGRKKKDTNFSSRKRKEKDRRGTAGYLLPGGEIGNQGEKGKRGIRPFFFHPHLPREGREKKGGKTSGG